MCNLLRLIAIIAIALLGKPVIAQHESESGTPRCSEDQMIAEAMWSLVDLGTSDPVDIQSGFDEATKAFPQSAKVAYWRGRCGAYAIERSRVLEKVSDILGTLSDPDSNDSELADPSLDRKMNAARTFAKIIGTRIEQRAKDQSIANENENFEIALLNAVSLDTTLVAAWAGLLESGDSTIALTAADAWSNQETDNALPLYAKAVIFTRDKKRDDPIDMKAIAALELGNLRSACRAPDEPWPTDFSLNFPNSLPKDAADLEGKPVTPQMLRKVVEGMFFQVEAIGGGATLSESAIRGLGSTILGQSHRLSRQEDVRYLRAFAGVGVHLVQSNRFLYGVTAGNVDRILNRLETIAIDQGDFDSANEFFGIREYVLTIRRRVANGYRASDFGEDPARIDLEATKIMEDCKKTISIPHISFSEDQSSNLVLADGMDDKANTVLLDLFYSSDRRVFVRGPGQKSPDEELNSDRLSERGYATLAQRIDAVRESNRLNRRSQGILLLASNPNMSREIADECFVSGYVGERDPCIVAFTENESLEEFREFYPHVDVRIAQVLGAGDELESDDTKHISKEADFVVVPLSRLLHDDGHATPFVLSTELEFIATAVHPDQLKFVEGIESIVGTAPFNLLNYTGQDDEPE